MLQLLAPQINDQRKETHNPHTDGEPPYKKEDVETTTQAADDTQDPPREGRK